MHDSNLVPRFSLYLRQYLERCGPHREELQCQEQMMVQFRDISREDKVKRDLIRAEEARRVSEQQLEYLARYNAMG